MSRTRVPFKYICLPVLACMLLLSACRGGSRSANTKDETKETLTGEAVSEEAVSEGALSGEAVSEGALSEEPVSEGALSEEAVSEGALTEGSVAEDPLPGPALPQETAPSAMLETTGSEPFSRSSQADPADEPTPAFAQPWLYLLPDHGLLQQMDIPLPAHTLALLHYALTRQLAAYDGEWSVSVRDLSTGERFVINDGPMPSASELKLFIMGCVYEDIRIGNLERTGELVDQLTAMICSSSNECANRILEKLGAGDLATGIEHLNGYIRQAGFSDNTRAYNPFNDEAHRLDDKHNNQTSADDCAELLERIYRRYLGTRAACSEAEQLLLSQETRFKIPSMIPDTCQVANKTGETDEVENDVALVYTPAGDYILSVLSTGWADKKTAQTRIKAISAEVYAYFSDPDYAERVIRTFILPES